MESHQTKLLSHALRWINFAKQSKIITTQNALLPSAYDIVSAKLKNSGGFLNINNGFLPILDASTI
jgi:hypothetical protein